MPAARLRDLAGRRRLLVAQADLHRHLIAVEHFNLESRLDDARARIHGNRWWLVAGAVGVGFLVVRHRRFGRWLRSAVTAWRLMESFRRS